jgi:multidrug transporter EmrE-like cation transporter
VIWLFLLGKSRGSREAEMKKTVLLILFSLLFVFTFLGVASAIPTLGVAYTVSEPASMVVIGFALIGLAEIRKKI